MKKSLLWLLPPLIFIMRPARVFAGNSIGSCKGSITPFSCPLCGGIYVLNCLECDGYTNTGESSISKEIDQFLMNVEKLDSLQKKKLLIHPNQHFTFLIPVKNWFFSRSSHMLQQPDFLKKDIGSDPENHYHYLWNDIGGFIAWFLATGVATACGVGGGGIYVPLGMIIV